MMARVRKVKPVVINVLDDGPRKVVVMTCETRNAQIRYTLDGTDPTPASRLYTAPLVIEAP